MAVYKAVDAEKLDADLEAVADGIRSISGNTAALSFPSGFRAEMDEAVAEIGVQTNLIAQIKAALEMEPEPGPGPEPIRRLPEGYTQLNYIRSTRTQNINTKFAPNQNTRVVMDCEVGEGASTFFGVWTALNNNQYIFMSPDGPTPRYHYGNTYTVGTGTLSGRVTIDTNKNKVYINGVVSVTMNSSTFQCAYPLYLCTINSGSGPVDNQNADIKIYSCLIYDNDALIRDYVPCINDVGLVGLYDMVNEEFYGNAGSGQFEFGSVVAA